MSKLGRDVPRIAVVGVGNWGRNLVRNFAELGALAAVADADEARARQVAASFAVPARTFDSLLSDASIDAVAIATPSLLHAEHAKIALAAAKHVFLEKPATYTEEKLRELTALAHDRAKTFMVGHVLRFHPGFRAALNYARSGAIGTLRSAHSRRTMTGPSRNSDDAIWDLAPHDVSMLVEFGGGEPAKVESKALNRTTPLVEGANIRMTFQNGVHADVMVAYRHTHNERRITFVGDDGSITFDESAPSPEKMVTMSTRDTSNGEKAVLALPFPMSEPLRIECAHFLECIATGRSSITDGQEAMRVLRVLLRARSSLEKQRPREMDNVDETPLVLDTAGVKRDQDASLSRPRH